MSVPPDRFTATLVLPRHSVQPLSAHEPFWGPALVLLASYLLITGWNLHIQTIENPDEPRYAAAARTMVRGGDPMLPEFNGRPRIVKPILFYWLIAATGTIGEKLGLDLAAGFRIAPVLMGLLTVFGIFILARAMLGTQAGFIASALLMTSYFFHEQSRELVVDMTMTAWLMWAWVFAYAALGRIRGDAAPLAPHSVRETTYPDSLHVGTPLPFLLGFYVCLGLACLTKGPLHVVIFVVVPLLAYLVWTDRLGDLKKAGLYWGIPLGAAIGCWWFLVLQSRGYNVIELFKAENINRVTGQKDHYHPIPFLLYLLRLCEGLTPWIVLVPVALIWSWKRSSDPPPQPLPIRKWDDAKLVVCSFGIPFLFWCLLPSKRSLYILPLYPFIALWLAWFWKKTILDLEGQPSDRRAQIILVGMAIVIAAAGVLFIGRPFVEINPSERIAVTTLCMGIVLGLLFVALSLSGGHRYRASLQLLAVASALVIGFEAVGRPVRERSDNRAQFYRKLCEQLNGRPLVMLGHSSNEAVWYLDRPGEKIDDLRRAELKERFFEKPGTLLLITLDELKESPALKKSIRYSELHEMCGGKVFALAEPDPENPPEPSVFEPRAKRKKNENPLPAKGQISKDPQN